MSIFRKVWFWLLLLNLSLWLAVFSLPKTGELKLVFCDVGQGDAVLVTKGSLQVLIDGGPNEKVMNCLGNHLPFWDKTIEMVVLTHGEKDHLGGLINVLESYRVSCFVTDNTVVDSKIFRRFEELVLESGAVIVRPKIGDRLIVGDLEFDLLWPPDSRVLGTNTTIKEPNERSIVLSLKFGQVRAMLTGDISSKTEEGVGFSGAEILKIPHHGSKYSTGDFLLGEVNPKLAVISVGKNSFGHPTKEVLERLESRSIKIWRTDTDGELVLHSFGQDWSY